jgi:hypothetical protein
MPRPSEDLSPSTLAQECGLSPPGPGQWTWLGDAHLLWAVSLAVPVWIALGLTVAQRMQVPVGWSGWLSLVLVQPLVEELVFRGLLQGQLLRLSSGRRLGPLTLANLGTSTAFVALHFMAQPAAWALAVAVPSLVFGHLRERLASVWPAVFLHALYNAGFGVTAWLARA